MLTSLKRDQAEDWRTFDQDHGAEETPERQQAQALLQQQHSAEETGTEASLTATHCRDKNPREADDLAGDSREAFQMARDRHEERQNLGTEREGDRGFGGMGQGKGGGFGR